MTFRLALSGLNAASSDLNVTANNIANSSTTGFKESRAEFAELFAVSPQGVATLAGQELRLARAEMSEKTRHLIPGLGMMAAAGAAALIALGTLTAFVVLALSEVMDAWLAALIVGAAWALVAAGLYFAGRERVSEAGSLVPEQTMESVKEDVEWAKSQIG